MDRPGPVAPRTNGPALYSLLGCALAALWQIAARPPTPPHEERAFLLVDALGLAVFAATGARLGAEAGLGAWSVTLPAALTGAGGGVIRDLLVLDVLSVSPPLSSLAAFGVTFLLRTAAIFRGWSLPRLPL